MNVDAMFMEGLFDCWDLVKSGSLTFCREISLFLRMEKWEIVDVMINIFSGDKNLEGDYWWNMIDIKIWKKLVDDIVSGVKV